MPANSVREGMVRTAPRCSRLILPSKALGFARKIAIIILCRSDSDRSPTRQATPRSVALAPTLMWVVLRTAVSAGVAAAVEVATAAGIATVAGVATAVWVAGSAGVAT